MSATDETVDLKLATAPNDGPTPAPAVRAGDRRDPDRIGRFAVRRRLGEGGMGVVFVGHDDTLEREVALKLVHPELGGDVHVRMLREAQAMARVAHPNVVAVYEAGVHEDGMYIAMELIQGETLDAWIERVRPAPREVLARLVECGRALAAAHRAGVLHRDFKPGNVLVATDGRARVLDFGLACAVRAPAVTSMTSSGALAVELTQVGAIVGTPAFMAPEQFEGEASERTDQWSFAVTCYRGLFGKLPFDGDGLIALMAAIQLTDPPAAPVLADVPPSVTDAILRGLARDPGGRWPSIEAMTDALAAALAVDPERDLARSRRQRRLLAATVIAFAVPVGVATGMRTRMGRDVDASDTLFQIALAFAVFAACTLALRRTVLRDAHGRRVVMFWGVLFAAVTAHRAISLDLPVPVILRSDAFIIASAAVIAAATIERWFSFIAVAMAVFLAVSFAAPGASFAAFGATMIGCFTLALYFWRPGRS